MNALGARVLLAKEVRRFLRVPGQTVLSPLVSTVLYFLVFGVSPVVRNQDVEGTPYPLFIVPGLVFLGVATNSFLNSSSSMFIAKIQGTVVDLLVAPLGPLELLTGFIGGAMVRGLAVGLLTWVGALAFTGFRLAHPVTALVALLLCAYVFSMLGLLAALWAEKFEQINVFPAFVMLPLTFLGGVFYSVRQLRAPFDRLSLANPVVHLVDLVRFGMLGRSVVSPWIGAGMLVGLSVASTWMAWALLRRGYKLRS